MAQEDHRDHVESVHRSASMFDLEPNPFEQSFASTKKSQSVSAAVPNPQDHRLNDGVTGPVGERSSKVTISEITSNNRELDQRRSSVFSYGAQKPHLHSPPLLTPGGSRRLPPILLSPNFHQQTGNGGLLSGQGPLSAHMPNYSNLSPKNDLPNVSMDLQRPPLNLSLSKTVFTPNESNLRTGLTPNILGPAHQMPHPTHTLPYFNGPRSDLGTHDDHRNPSNYGLSMGMNGDLSGQMQPYPPAVGSLSSYSSTQQFQRSNNALPRNGVPSQGSGSLIESHNSKQSTQMNNYVVEQTASSTKDQQAKSTNPSSPPRTASRRKRKSSTPSRGSKSSKSSQRNTPTSQDSKNLGKKDSNDSVDRDSDEGQDRKRREFLERNRVAASKFRKRKKEYIKRVEMDLKFYEAEYDDMSHAINKMCGVLEGSSPPSNSLVCMLETAISKNDTTSSLSILAHIKQVLYETRYFQRNGRNPRREIEYPQDSEDEERRRTDKELSNSRHNSLAGITSSVNSSRTPGTSISGPVAASYISNGAPPSVSTGSSKSVLTDATSVPSVVKVEDPASVVYPMPTTEVKKPSAVPSAIGTISSLPTVINGRPVIPLNDIDPHSNPDPNSLSGLRQSSLVSLAPGVVNSEPITFKYPNSD